MEDRLHVTRALAAAVLVLHGGIHLLGVPLMMRISQPGELRYGDTLVEAGSFEGIVVGLLWAVAAVAFMGAGVLLARHDPACRTVALAAVAASLPAVLLSIPSAAAMAVAIDLVVVAVALHGRHPVAAR